MICAIPLLYYSLSDHHLKAYSIAIALRPFNKIKSIDPSILNQNSSNFAKTLVFGDPVNSVTIDTLILLLQMLLLTLLPINFDTKRFDMP